MIIDYWMYSGNMMRLDMLGRVGGLTKKGGIRDADFQIHGMRSHRFQF